MGGRRFRYLHGQKMDDMHRYYSLLLLLIALQTQAQKEKPTPPWFVERFRVTAGTFFPINNTTITVGNQAGTFGTTIDFEDDLGFSRNTFTFLADVQWRASRRSRFDLSYYRVARNSGHVLDRTLEFGDHVYPVHAAVSSFFNTDIFRFSYGYALYTSPKAEVGLLVGAHIIGADVGISLENGSGSIDLRNDFGFTAPLPDFGIWGGYAITKRWAVNGEFDYFTLTINDISGRILAGSLSVQYLVIPQLSVTAGYTGMNFKVDVEKERLKGYFKWGYNGPSLTASFIFGRKRW